MIFVQCPGGVQDISPFICNDFDLHVHVSDLIAVHDWVQSTENNQRHQDGKTYQDDHTAAIEELIYPVYRLTVLWGVISLIDTLGHIKLSIYVFKLKPLINIK